MYTPASAFAKMICYYDTTVAPGSFRCLIHPKMLFECALPPAGRAIRETHMNQASSRSHSIFQIVVEQKRRSEQEGERVLRSKFNLVDLAG